MSYDTILEQQFAQKDRLVKSPTSINGGITIIIKNNEILSVTNGLNYIYPNRKQMYTELFENVCKKHKIKDCVLNINLLDTPVNGYFNFCRRVGAHAQFLLPNFRFTNEDIIKAGPTFDDTIRYLRSLWIPFESKKPSFYMNCAPHESKRSYFEYAAAHDFCKGYAYGGTVHKYFSFSPALIEELTKRGMLGVEKDPFENHIQHKYVIYNDGITLSDRTRLLLNTGSVLIRKESHFEEFYTYLLKPNVHYISYKEDNDLQDIYTRLEADISFCKTLVNNCSRFVDEMLNYDAILKYTADLINGLF